MMLRRKPARLRIGCDALGVYGDVSALTRITTASPAEANIRWSRQSIGDATCANGTNRRAVIGIRMFPENAKQNACKCEREHRASVADAIPGPHEYQLQATKLRRDLRQDRPRKITQTKIMQMNLRPDEDEPEDVDDPRANAEHAAAAERRLI
jgi:hypothetical protein